MKRMAATLCLLIASGALQASAQAQAPRDEAKAPRDEAKAERQRPNQAGRAAAIDRRADANADGKVSLEELRAVNPQLTQKRFKSMDKNGDGFITGAEAPRNQRGRNQNQQIHRQMLTKMLASDRDGDLKVSYQELIQAKPGFPRANFDRLDLNGDGILTKEDMRSPQRAGARPRATRESNGAGNRRAQDRDAFMRRLQSADTDRNGKITLDEMRRIFPRITEERFRQMDGDGNGVLTSGEGPQRPR